MTPTRTGQFENQPCTVRPRELQKARKGRGSPNPSRRQLHGCPVFSGRFTRRAAAPPCGRWGLWPGARLVQRLRVATPTPCLGLTDMGLAGSSKQGVFGRRAKAALAGIPGVRRLSLPAPAVRAPPTLSASSRARSRGRRAQAPRDLAAAIGLSLPVRAAG